MEYWYSHHHYCFILLLSALLFYIIVSITVFRIMIIIFNSKSKSLMMIDIHSVFICCCWCMDSFCCFTDLNTTVQCSWSRRLQAAEQWPFDVLHSIKFWPDCLSWAWYFCFTGKSSRGLMKVPWKLKMHGGPYLTLYTCTVNRELVLFILLMHW